MALYFQQDMKPSFTAKRPIHAFYEAEFRQVFRFRSTLYIHGTIQQIFNYMSSESATPNISLGTYMVDAKHHSFSRSLHVFYFHLHISRTYGGYGVFDYDMGRIFTFKLAVTMNKELNFGKHSFVYWNSFFLTKESHKENLAKKRLDLCRRACSLHG